MLELGRLCTQPQLGSAWITHADGAAAGYLLAVYVFSLEHHGLTALRRDNDAARAFYRRHGYRARAGYELLDKSLPAA